MHTLICRNLTSLAASVVAMLATALSPAHAEPVPLNNGSVVNGDISNVTAQGLQVRLPYGAAKYSWSQVDLRRLPSVNAPLFQTYCSLTGHLPPAPPAPVARPIMAPKATAPAVSGNNAPAKAASTSSIVFEDHFKGPEIDKNTWLVEKAAGRGQNTPRADLQFYLPEALRINQGLRIVAESASIDDPVTGVHFNYSSGRIRSKKTFLYGRFEFRAKLPRGRGLWPGLWMRTPPPEAMNGEIDVIEGYGSHPNIVRSTLHPWVNGKESKSYSCLLYVRSKPDSPSFASAKKVRINLPRDLASDYHSYAVEWRADYITWFLDGAPYFTVREEIPKLPMAIMIEMAIASHWDGVPDKSLVLPQTFEISDVVVRE